MARPGDSCGFKLPDDRLELTANEMRWLEILRDLHAGRVRAPRLIYVQALREALWGDLEHGFLLPDGEQSGMKG